MPTTVRPPAYTPTYDARPRASAPQRRTPGRAVPERPSVLLLDEGWAATTFVATALRDAGCDVHIRTASPDAGDTRFLGDRLERRSVPRVVEPGYLAAVDRAVAELNPDVVMPLTENVFAKVWAAPPAWEERIFPRTAAWQHALLGDKHAMSTFVARLGVPVPRAAVVRSDADVDAAIAAVGLPAVVKGRAGIGGERVHVAPDRARVLAGIAAERAHGDGDPELQEFVVGATYLAGGLFADGEPVRYFAAEKSELYPPVTGPSMRLRSDTSEELRASTLSVFRALRWTGIASADFVRGSDGRFYFLEVNPRPWGSVAAATAAGVDVAGGLAEVVRGRRPSAQLRFRHDVHVAVVPQYPAGRLRREGARALPRLAADPALWRFFAACSPGVALHLARGLYWDARAALQRGAAPAA